MERYQGIKFRPLSLNAVMVEWNEGSRLRAVKVTGVFGEVESEAISELAVTPAIRAMAYLPSN